MKLCLPLMFLAMMLLSVAARAGSVEDQLNRLEEQRHQALAAGNWNDLEALHSDDFLYSTATGTVLTKAAFIDYMKSGAVVVKRAARDPAIVRSYGNVALVTGIEHVQASIKGEDKMHRSRYLHVWVNEARGWRLAARQATLLPERPQGEQEP